jgi:coproporphyrinogen III oxidase-like Fe-S oxidoreductase
MAQTATTEKKTEVGSVFVSNYPPYSFWNTATVERAHAVLAAPPRASTPLGLYLHVPFCRRRCKFCYFKVYTDKNASQVQDYLDALAREAELYAAQPAVRDRRLKFVYFGGGTPSYVAVKHLEGLLARVKAALPWDEVEEVTFECEPGTLTESKVAAYRELGITRLSLGVEHFDDEVLAENGRAHVSKEIYRCLPWIRAQGFPQLNIDLIAGMVGDTWEKWRAAVAKTIEVDPDSVTIYQMELPYNTVYSQGILEGGESPVADWETKRAWHDYAIEELKAVGYEVSSAYTLLKRRDAKAPRFLYRDALWHGADMLGTGVASFGHMSGVHMQNLSSWADYLAQLERGELPLGRAFATTASERLTRELILQMKLGRVEPRYFRDKFDVDVLAEHAGAFEKLAEKNMLTMDDGAVRLTRQGLLRVDSLLPRFYDERYRGARYT